MKILGISGLENSMPFKRESLPGLDEREYRISQGHDSAAALVVDGEIVAAAAEERFNRVKHSGDFPVAAIDYCLKEGGLGLADIDEIAHAFNYSGLQGLFSLNAESMKLYNRVFSRDAFMNTVRYHLPDFPSDRIYQVNHHLAHAASAYFTSGWDECVVLVIDGMGETDSANAYVARNGALQRVHHISAQDSIGVFYSLITLLLGFDFNSDEYKIMGLAPYGDPSRFRDFFSGAVILKPGGAISIPILRMNKSYPERQGYTATRSYLAGRLAPERQPDAEITDIHRDMAAALQECLDKAMLHVCAHLAAKTGLKRLAMAGGVALNCTANGKLLESGLFDDLYIQPAAGDDGAALGAALLRASRRDSVRNRRMRVPFLGPWYSPDEVEKSIGRAGNSIEVTRFESLAETCDAAATLIANGSVIGWYRGRMEFGPRALGHRSILADPGRPEMRDRINAMVKMREAFRPFAPAVTLEEAAKWFDVGQTSSLSRVREFPYMITTVNVREQYRAQLPAVTHVNGSARLQTVSEADNNDFHCLLRAVGARTGREMVLNTSFNIKGQPIVNTPTDAIDTFLSTGIDYLVIENALISRSRRSRTVLI